MSRCFCACHEYPGIYRGEPCAYCGHFNSKGHMPGTVRDGWEPYDSAESQLATIAGFVQKWEAGIEGCQEVLEAIAHVLKTHSAS